MDAVEFSSHLELKIQENKLTQLGARLNLVRDHLFHNEIIAQGRFFCNLFQCSLTAPPLSISPLTLCPRNFANIPASKHAGIGVLHVIFSMAFTFPVDSGPGAGTNWMSRV